MALELETNSASITLYFDSAGQALLDCNDQPLAEYDDGVLLRSDAATVEVSIHGPEGWSLAATHEDDEGELVTWPSGPRGPTFSFGEPTTDPLEVTIIVSQTEDAPKKKKVRIDAKPGGALPDRS